MEKQLSQTYCETGTSSILDVVADSSHFNNGIVYASTNRGDIIVFE